MQIDARCHIGRPGRGQKIYTGQIFQVKFLLLSA